LCDHIDFCYAPSAAFSVTITGSGGVRDIPLEKNLMYRAALLFHQETGRVFSLRIAIEKNIPQGAGLGGGSSNAASVLGALIEAASFPLPHEALMDAAARLGSDVPFFIEGKPALVTGRGENVRPFDLKRDFFFVLVKPAFESGTAEAYRLLDEWRSASPHSFRSSSTPSRSVPPETLIAALDKPPSQWPYRNDFQSVFLDDRYPHARAYRELFASLEESGASFTLLSGSGSTVFGVYETEYAAAEAVARLKTRGDFPGIIPAAFQKSGFTRL
jgi:4-diphosphocytidyl-2-C-methyl-D-erythritol kinase